MSVSNSIDIQLQKDAISEIPFHIYDNDFTFIVNNQEFKTNKIIAELLSPKICNIHINDPTSDTFVINTAHQGQFSRILQLFNFTIQTIPESDLLFISEVLQILDNPNFQIFIPSENDKDDLTLENVIKLIQFHEKNQFIYSKIFQDEINFISMHFFELSEAEEAFIRELNFDTIERIINNEHIQLRDENQLIFFINQLYIEDRKYSQLYEYVLFAYLSETTVEDFIDVFDLNDIDHLIWFSISQRLKERITLNENNKRYIRGKIFFDKENQFEGIINYLKKESNNNIEDLINITSSTIFKSNSPYNVCLFDNNEKFFKTKNEENSWICFDFKNHRIIPTSYVIKSYDFSPKSHHPKSWVIEGSNDNLFFDILDNVENCSYLKGASRVHTFTFSTKISNEYRYIRMRQTSSNCSEPETSYMLALGSIEFYGKIIKESSD